MKLITHNLLASNVPKISVSYPLRLEVTKFEVEQHEFVEDFILNIIPRLNYPALRSAAAVLNHQLPEELPFSLADDVELLKQLHHVLLNIEIIEGTLICPSSGRQFPITGGIPNMLLTEEELA